MLILSLITVAMSSLAWNDSAPRYSNEVYRTPDGTIFCWANAAIPFGWFHRVALVPGDSGDEFFVTPLGRGANHSAISIDTERQPGPPPLGVVDGVLYSASHRRPNGVHPLVAHDTTIQSIYWCTVVDTIVQPVDGMVELERRNRRQDWTSEQGRSHINDMWNFGQRHGCHVLPLMDFIKEHALELNQEWDLRFDLVYTSRDDVILAFCRGGLMQAWDLHGTGDNTVPWTQRATFRTAIDEPFRMMRPGDDANAPIYFIDESGGIHHGVGDDHRQVGLIAGFIPQDRNERTFLFEDQQLDRIGAFTESPTGELAVLSIDWTEEGHAAHFMTEFDSDRTREQLARMTAIVREKEEEDDDKGDGDGE